MTTRRRHRPRTSIIVTTLFSIFYFVSVFTSKIDILLPSYLKSASESVHQLHSASEALSYLECIEELAHPAAYLLEYIMSRAPSDIGDISGVMGGRPQPPSPPTSVHASPSPAPQSPLGPLDLLNKPDIIKGVAEFHIKRDASYIAPASLDIKGSTTCSMRQHGIHQTSRSMITSSGTSGLVHHQGVTTRSATSS